MSEAHDPVCGMSVNEEEARTRGLVVEGEGHSYCFCSPSCKSQFEKEHRRRAQAAEEKAPDGKTDERYAG